MPKSPTVKSLIKNLEAEELREIIVELSKLSAKNKQFLQLFLQRTDAADLDAITTEAKNKIYNYLYGRGAFPKIDLMNARKIVNEYGKILKEYPARTADLKLYYVELGTRLTNEFGSMDERYYSSMESMYKSFCKEITKHPGHYAQFKDRIQTLLSQTDGIDYGYGMVIEDFTADLEAAMGD